MSPLFALTVLSKTGNSLVVQLNGLKKIGTHQEVHVLLPSCEHTGGELSLGAWQDMSKSEMGATTLPTCSIDCILSTVHMGKVGVALLFFIVSEKIARLLAEKAP